jgi:hypothetical protein
MTLHKGVAVNGVYVKRWDLIGRIAAVPIATISMARPAPRGLG